MLGLTNLNRIFKKKKLLVATNGTKPHSSCLLVIKVK